MPGHPSESWWQRLRSLGYHSGPLVFPRLGLPLHAMPTSCGLQWETGESYDWNGLARGNAEFAVFQWTMSGRGLLTWEGHDHDLTPGVGMVVRIPHAHRYRVHPGSLHWEFLYVCLSGRDVIEAVRAIHDLAGPVVRIGEDSDALQAALGIYQNSLAGRPWSPFEASALAYRMAMGVLDRAASGRVAVQGRAATQAAIEYCREHLDDSLSVDILASCCGMSRFHFSRLFKAEHGMPPAAYILHQRVRRAVRLLRESEAPLKQIAGDCGFANANYFGKAFRRHMGSSPAAFRRSGV